MASPRPSCQSEAKSMASTSSSRLPMLVKSIHGPGAKYFYLGKKRLDETFWDPKFNPDLYNWNFHRTKLKTQECNVDAEISPEFLKQVEILNDRAKKKRMLSLKEIEERNNFLAEFQALCVTSVDDHLSDVVENKRVFKKDNSEMERNKQNTRLSTENKVYTHKMRNSLGSVSFGKSNDSFQFHLQRMHQLTRFPLVHNYASKSTPSLKGSSLNLTEATPRENQPPVTSRSKVSKEGRKSKLKPDQASLGKEGKRKTLLSARKNTETHDESDKNKPSPGTAPVSNAEPSSNPGEATTTPANEAN